MTTGVAFLFPGQGSQATGMGADIFASSPAARRVFEHVDQALGFSLSALCFTGPDETLRETVHAQPAIVTVSLALLAALQEALAGQMPDDLCSWTVPLTPAYTAGHSVGEYAALVVSGSLTLADAVRLLRERGRLMQHESSVCPGAMAAIIALDERVLQDVCAQATSRASAQRTGTHPGEGQVAIANYNAPGQLVISGAHSALELAMTLARERGAKKVMPLAVSGAFHSPAMQPAAAGLAEAIAATIVTDARIPLIGNMHASPLSEAAAIREELAGQIAASVQWIRSIEYLINAGVTIFIEIGLGQALTGMVKRIAKGTTLMNVSSGEDIIKVVDMLRRMNLAKA
jgi:[acyl-carrier-protein] S-malonyltransferase